MAICWTNYVTAFLETIHINGPLLWENLLLFSICTQSTLGKILNYVQQSHFSTIIWDIKAHHSISQCQCRFAFFKTKLKKPGFLLLKIEVLVHLLLLGYNKNYSNFVSGFQSSAAAVAWNSICFCRKCGLHKFMQIKPKYGI